MASLNFQFFQGDDFKGDFPKVEVRIVLSSLDEDQPLGISLENSDILGISAKERFVILAHILLSGACGQQLLLRTFFLRH